MAILDFFERKTRVLLGLAIIATAVSAVLVVGGGAPVITFFATAIALAMLASLVGEGTEQLGARQGPAVTVGVGGVQHAHVLTAGHGDALVDRVVDPTVGLAHPARQLRLMPPDDVVTTSAPRSFAASSVRPTPAISGMV